MIRYFDGNKKALPSSATSGANELECVDKQAWYDSANVDNLVWTSTEETVAVDLPVYDDEGEPTGETVPTQQTNVIWSVRFKTEDEKNEFAIEQIIAKMQDVRKIQVRRTMRAMGIETQLDAVLSNELFKKDWDDCGNCINLTDPVVIEALSQATIDIDAVKREIAIELLNEEIT